MKYNQHELPQLESDYGKVGMQKVITTVGNVVSGSARAKESILYANFLRITAEVKSMISEIQLFNK